MAYFVDITEDDERYLDSLPLSKEARNRIQNFLVNTIGNVADAIRNDPGNRHEGSDQYFWSQFVILDAWGDNRSHRIDVIINDAAAAHGVLRIVYIEHLPPA